MHFRTTSNRRQIIKAGAFTAASLGLGSFSLAAAQTPESSPVANDGEFASVDGNLNLTWDGEKWEMWESDDTRVVIGSDGDGSAPYAYRFRSTVAERFWEDGEAELESMLEEGGTLDQDDVMLIDSKADADSIGYVRRMQSPGGEAFSIFEFQRVSDDSTFWVSSEAWIHVDPFDVDDAITQYSTLSLNDAPVPTLWPLDEIMAKIAETRN